MNIYLHIGSGKTGTTAIQNHFFHNREEYLKVGLYYPSHGLQGSGHHGLAVLGCATMPAAVKESFVNIINEANENACETILISSENLCFMTPEYIAEIADLFEGYVPKVIFYVRDQAALIESTYLEWQKSGGPYKGGIDKLFHTHQNAFSLMKRITPWVRNFGQAQIRARLYDKKIIGDDVCSDIRALIGMSVLPSLDDKPVNANASLLAEFSNFVTSYDESQATVDERKMFIDELLSMSQKYKQYSTRCLISDSLREKITEKYSETNKEFSELFLDQEQADILKSGSLSC